MNSEVFLDAEDFIMYSVVLPFLLTAGIVLTSFGIAQLVVSGKTMPWLKALPVVKMTVLSVSISVPITLLTGVGLFALAVFLILKTREVVIEL